MIDRFTSPAPLAEGPVCPPIAVRRSAYLIGNLRDGAIVSLMMKSEPPWQLTRRWRGGVATDEMVLLYEGQADSYAEAIEQVKDAYPRHFPRLAARFPLSEVRGA